MRTKAQSRPKLLDLVYGLVLFLVVTDLYRFIAFWARLNSFAPVAATFALASMIYAFWYWRYAWLPLTRATAWTGFLLLVPFISLGYTLNPNFRDMALQVLFFALLLGSKTFFARPSTKPLRSVLLSASLITGFAGIVLSIVSPCLFLPASLMIDDPTPYHAGRGYGFYLEPNQCATSLTLLFFLWLFVVKPRLVFRTVLSVFYLLAILLTGSRGGILMSLLLLSSHTLLPSAGWSLPRFCARLIRLGVLGGMTLVLLISTVFAVAPHLATGGALETLNRIKSMGKEGQLLDKDASVKGRLHIQRDYLGKIAERPFLGYGIASARVVRERGDLCASSHNTFLEYSFSYGLAGVLIGTVLALMIWEDCRALRSMMNHKVDLVLFGVLFVACMVSNTILIERVPYIVFGWVLAKRYPYVHNAGLRDTAHTGGPSRRSRIPHLRDDGIRQPLYSFGRPSVTLP